MKVIETVLDVLIVLFFAWVILSWIEVMRNNLMVDPVYWEYNFFEVMLALRERLN